MRVLPGHLGTIRCVSYAPDGRLASGAEDGTIRIWNTSSGTAERVLKGKAGGVETLTFTHDGKWLAAGTAEGRLVLYDWEKGRKVAEATGPAGGVRALAHAVDRPAVLVLGWNRGLFWWEIGGSRRRGFPPPQPFAPDFRSMITALAFSPDGATLAGPTWDDEGIALLDARTGEQKGDLYAEDPVLAVAFSADGKFVAAGEQMGAVVIWDVERESDVAHLAGHEWVVFAVAFSRDGTSLISGGADGTVRVWDVAARQQRECYRWTGQCVTCLAISPDGMTAAAGGAEGSLVVWDLVDS
jgi:WD40 repeat protein